MQSSNEAELKQQLAAAKAEIELNEINLGLAVDYQKQLISDFHAERTELKQQLAARDLVIKHAKKFIFEWDLARSSGEWPYRVLQELREALAVSSTEALDAYVQRAVLEEREWILSIYSPDDSANDYLDKIRGRGN